MAPEQPRSEAQTWFETHTRHPGGALDFEALVEAKRAAGRSVTVCLPARNEAATVGAICHTLRTSLLDRGAIDQLVVMDSRSEDATAEIARAAGAEVHSVSEVLPDLPGLDGGKGEVLWKSLAIARGDIMVWADSDIRNFDPAFVTRLIQPLLEDDELVLTKAFYERPLVAEDGTLQRGGARVTELVARPLLNLFYPELAGIVQPLSGEYAIRTDAARCVPFLSGYACDVGLLISVAEEYGVDRIVQVDLGTRVHRNQEIPALGRMAHQVMQGMLRLFDEMGRLKLLDDLPNSFTQFGTKDTLTAPDTFDIGVVEFPRMMSVLKES